MSMSQLSLVHLQCYNCILFANFYFIYVFNLSYLICIGCVLDIVGMVTKCGTLMDHNSSKLLELILEDGQ